MWMLIIISEDIPKHTRVVPCLFFTQRIAFGKLLYYAAEEGIGIIHALSMGETMG
jgi:hypothetical protein